MPPPSPAVSTPLQPGEAPGEPRPFGPGGAVSGGRPARHRLYGEPVPPASSPSVLVVDAVGAAVAIDLTELDDPARAAVRRAWSGAVAAPGTTPRHTVTPAASTDPDAMLAPLSSAVTLGAIEARRGELWMLHAAGLAGPDGGVVVLVGPSGAGKTTAIHTLAASAGYVSDETVGIDDRGGILAYRKPLSILTDGLDYKVQRSPDEVPLGALPDRGLRLSRLILLDRRPDHGTARLVPVPMGEAIAALAAQSSGLAALPRPVRAMVRLIERTGGVLRAEYTESRDLAPLVDAVLAEPAPPPLDDEGQPFPADASSSRAPRDDAPGPHYERTDAVDWCALPDGQLAVLTAHADGSGTLRILAGIAPTVWRAAETAPRDEIVAAVEARFACDDPGDLTDRVLAELVEAGLLRITA